MQPGIVFAPGTYMAMTDNPVPGDRPARAQREDELGRGLVLSVRVRLGCQPPDRWQGWALVREPDPDRVVIAVVTAEPGGPAGVPGALNVGHELVDQAVALDEI